jgi:hypothetical protein
MERDRRAGFFTEGEIVPTTASLGYPTNFGFTPQQLRRAYGFDRVGYLQQNYNALAGLGETICIVGAKAGPSISYDLSIFNSAFGLPPCQLKIVDLDQLLHGHPAGTPNAGWIEEAALDIEWAHAVAPAANILVLEATDSAEAVGYACTLPEVSVVSMSFGGPEDFNVPTFEHFFRSDRVTLVGASGDGGKPAWPGVFPQVLAVGGTDLQLAPDGTIISETTWPNSGHGQSIQFPSRPPVPDMSYSATKVPIFCSDFAPGLGWLEVSGTSAAAPQVAAMCAIINQVKKDKVNLLATFRAHPEWFSTVGSPKVNAIANQLQVICAYVQILNRTPEPFGLSQWAALLERGQSNTWMRTQIAASDEFFAQSGATAKGFVDLLYNRVLRRPPAAWEETAWMNVFQQKGRLGVAAGIVGSSEAASKGG